MSICDACKEQDHAACVDHVRQAEFELWLEGEASAYATRECGAPPQLSTTGYSPSGKRDRWLDVHDAEKLKLRRLAPYRSCFCQHTTVIPIKEGI